MSSLSCRNTLTVSLFLTLSRDIFISLSPKAFLIPTGVCASRALLRGVLTPLHPLVRQVELSDGTAHTITDAYAGKEYIIQVAAKDNEIGTWSDWSVAAHATPWTEEPRHLTTEAQAPGKLAFWPCTPAACWPVLWSASILLPPTSPSAGTSALRVSTVAMAAKLSSVCPTLCS